MSQAPRASSTHSPQGRGATSFPAQMRKTTGTSSTQPMGDGDGHAWSNDNASLSTEFGPPHNSTCSSCSPGLPGNMKSKQVCRAPNGPNAVEFWYIYPHTLRTNATANEGRVGCWGWGAGHHHVCAGDRHGAYSVPVAPADGRFPRRGVFAAGAPQGSPARRWLALLICIRTRLAAVVDKATRRQLLVGPRMYMDMLRQRISTRIGIVPGNNLRITI
jgi:hypothetical protein